MRKYRIQIFILVQILCIHLSFGQFSPEEKKQLDSIQAVIDNPSSHDTIRALSYIDLANYYYIFDPDTCFVFCEKSKQISERINFTKGKCEVYGWLGYLNQIQGSNTEALKYFLQSKDIYEALGDTIGVSDIYSNLGGLYYNQGNIGLALEYYHKSLKIDESQGNQYGVANVYNNIGGIYLSQNENVLALEYFEKSLKAQKEIDDLRGMAGSISNIGMLHQKLRNVDEAIKYSKESLEIYQKLNDKIGIADSYNNLGLIYYNAKYFDQAIQFYEKSLAIRTELKDKDGMSYSYRNLALIEMDSNKPDSNLKALSMANKSLSLSTEIGFPVNIRNATKLLIRIYEKQGDGMKALEMHKLYIQMCDSINNIENQKTLIKQETKYEYEKKKAIDDKENEKKVAIEKEAQKRQFIVLVIIIIASTLVLILLLVIYRRLQLTRKQKLIIEEQKEEVETQRDQIEGQKDEIEQKHGEIQESITYAKRIQNAILPPSSFLNQHLPNNFVYYQPKDVVAGDFYWMEVHDDIVFFAAADCTGHGVPGAMVSVVCHNALNRAVREFGLRDTGKILDKVRELVLITFEKSEEQMKDGMDICLCALNKKSYCLQFSGANNPLYLIKDGELETIKGTKQPIGHVQDPKPFESHKIDLKDIHSFYLTTDGYADQFGGPKNKKFSYKRLQELLVENHAKPMDEQRDILKSQLNNWIEQGSDEQIDDVCIIGVKIN